MVFTFFALSCMTGNADKENNHTVLSTWCEETVLFASFKRRSDLRTRLEDNAKILCYVTKRSHF